jgi:putative SOS response-associated peptidase YedK
MCTIYKSNEYKKFEAFTIFSKPDFSFKRELYKDYPAAVIRRGKDGWSTDAATFGMVSKERIPQHVKAYDTMNARAETIGEKRSFSGAWKNFQLRLVPCEAFFEPNYESGKAARWRIALAGDQPTPIAGLWRAREEPNGVPSYSFAMLTVNADDHPLMKLFHKPDAEKRAVVIIRPDGYEDWLSCRNADEARSFLQLYPAEEMYAEPFPLAPRRPKAIPPDERQQSLLD